MHHRAVHIFKWTEVMMLKLPVEEIKRSISDTAVSMATTAFNARL